MSTIVDVPHR